MKEILKIKQGTKCKDLDDYYNFLNEKKDKEINILLPAKFSKNFVGLVPLFIQFISTWIKSSSYGKLLIDIDIDEINNNYMVEKLYDNNYFFVVVALVWNEKGVYDKKGENNLRLVLKDFQNNYFENMASLKIGKGESFVLSNLDHLPKRLGLLPFLEKEGNFIKNEDELFFALRDKIKSIFKFTKNIEREYFDLDIELHFNSIIYELLKNTYEWAKSDSMGVPILPNARGLYVNSFRNKKEYFLQQYDNDFSLKEYFECFETDYDYINFIEISIFDCGDGFIKKFNSEKDNSEKLCDIDIIQKCLTKHITSSMKSDKHFKGLGLDRILNILDNKGFFRIKTDKYFLYRNLIVNNIDKYSLKLFDVKNNDENYSIYNPASGSVVTIIYPLNKIKYVE